MKRARKYSNEPLGRVVIVKDFLLSPDRLVLEEHGGKATLSVSRRKKGKVPFRLPR